MGADISGERPCLVVVADDLTGAGDTAAQLRQWGLQTRVILEAQQLEAGHLIASCDVLVLNTHTRELPEAEAASQVASVGRAIRRLLDRVLCYKKLDSRLRGPFGSELAALAGSLQSSLVVMAPAFPEIGRITAGGYQLVHGHPAPGAGRNPGAAPVSAHLPTVLASSWSGPVEMVELPQVTAGVEALGMRLLELRRRGGVLAVVDATTRQHLETIAAACAPLDQVLLAGSGGLAGSLATAYGWVRDQAGPPLMVVCGSPHPTSRHQLAVLATTHDMRRVVCPVPRLLEAGTAPYVEACAAALQEGKDLLLTTGEPSGAAGGGSGQPASSPGLGQRLAAAVAELVHAVLTDANVATGGLVLSGGETALHIIRRLGGGSMTVQEEVLPGMPLSLLESGPFAGMPVITKSGSVGPDDAYAAAIQRLHRRVNHGD